MLYRLILLAIIGIVGAALASWLAAQPGVLQLEWFGWRLDMPTSLAVALVIVALIIIVMMDRLLRGIWRLPGWLGQTVQQRRDKTGHQALTLGFMAVSAGEAAEAKKQAARAQRLLQAPQLTALLSAQAAHLAGDHRAAKHYFTSLTLDQDTAFLGHVGLTRLALDDGKQSDALGAARAALRAKPKSKLAAQQALILEAKAGQWAAAMAALDVVSARLSKEDQATITLARQKTALAYLLACEAQHVDPGSKAVGKYLDMALASDPGFVPALVLVAGLHAEKAKLPRKIVKQLETGFATRPHSALAEALYGAWQVTDGTFIARLIKLIPAAGPGRVPAQIVVAEQAFVRGLVGEARGQLDAIAMTDRTVTAWRLLAQLVDEEDDMAVAHALRMASDAPRPHGWQCTSCRRLHVEWQSHCAACDAFGSLGWTQPDRITPERIMTSPVDASGRLDDASS